MKPGIYCKMAGKNLGLLLPRRARQQSVQAFQFLKESALSGRSKVILRGAVLRRAVQLPSL